MGRQRRAGAQAVTACQAPLAPRRTGRDPAVRRRMPAMALALALAAALSLAACGDMRGDDYRAAIRGVWQAIAGAPSAQALRQAAAFSGGGIAFSYPAPLAAGHVAEDGGDSWTFEHGMYTLELYVSPYAGTAEDYLEQLGAMYAGMKTGAGLVHGARAGRELALCGRKVRGSEMRVRLLGDETLYEAFDLPPARDGRLRLLIVSDEPVAGKPSPVAAASERMWQATLRCDPAHPAPAAALSEEPA